MIASCNISDFSQRISIDEVENNPFYNKLVFCIGAIYQDISDVHKGEEDIFKYLKPNEAYINDIFMMCRSMETCLDSINYAIDFISHYGSKDYCRKDFIPFDRFCLYHYDIICHKVSTLKDLYFKIVNKIYRLGLEKPTWSNIKKQKGKINNEHLFTILEDNYSLMESIDNERNMSSHEGNIHLSLLNDLSIYLMCSSLQGKLPTMEYDWKYQKGSIIYKSKIKQAKKEMLEYLNIVKYNAFFVTKCFMCSLSPQLESLLKEFFPSKTFENERSTASPTFCTMACYCKR